MLAQLTDRAHSAGIGRFTALVAAGNVAMARLLRNAGGSLVSRRPGTVAYELTLSPAQEHRVDLWPGPAD